MYVVCFNVIRDSYIICGLIRKEIRFKKRNNDFCNFCGITVIVVRRGNCVCVCFCLCAGKLAADGIWNTAKGKTFVSV